MIKVHHTSWYGKEITREWCEPFSSGTATGVKHMITFIDKKGKESTMVKWVVWDV